MDPTHWTSREALIISPRRREGLVEEVADGQTVVTNPRNDERYRLNETAAEVWHRCDGSTSTRQIAQALSSTYDVDLDVALDHVEQLITFFAERRLFRVA